MGSFVDREQQRVDDRAAMPVAFFWHARRRGHQKNIEKRTGFANISMNRIDTPSARTPSGRQRQASLPAGWIARLTGHLAALLLVISSAHAAGPPASPVAPASTAKQAASAATGSASAVPQPANGASASAAAAPASAAKPASASASIAKTKTPPAVDGPKGVKVPASARLVYDVTAQVRGGKYNANAELRWQHEGNRYDAQLEIRALSLVLRSQTSSGEVGPKGLAPTRFSDKTRTERVAYIDREKGRITFSADTPDVALQAGAQDRLSVVLQLSSLFATDPAAFAPGSGIAIQTVGPTDASMWHFTVKGEETVTVAGAQVRAIKLERDGKPDSDQQVEVWFAPLLGYIPVRLRITQGNGDYLDQRLDAMDKP